MILYMLSSLIVDEYYRKYGSRSMCLYGSNHTEYWCYRPTAAWLNQSWTPFHCTRPRSTARCRCCNTSSRSTARPIAKSFSMLNEASCRVVLPTVSYLTWFKSKTGNASSFIFGVVMTSLYASCPYSYPRTFAPIDPFNKIMLCTATCVLNVSIFYL